MKHFKKLLLATALGAACAQAYAGQDYTFNFNATCEDCALPLVNGDFGRGPASATLKLTNYVLGENISGHVSSLVYTSDKLGTLRMSSEASWSWGSFSSASGSLAYIPGSNGSNQVVVDFYTADGQRFGFGSFADGYWGIYRGGSGTFDDYGLSGSSAWSAAAVPEPETYAMLLAGLGLMGTRARFFDESLHLSFEIAARGNVGK
jgi:hypothetical protein